MLRAVEVARAAPIVEKAAPAEALASVACSVADVCAARDRCAHVYRLAAEGARLEHEARAGFAPLLAEIEQKVARPGQADRLRLLEEQADHAKAQVEAAGAALPACDDAVAAMRRAHAL